MQSCIRTQLQTDNLFCPIVIRARQPCCGEDKIENVALLHQKKPRLYPQICRPCIFFLDGSVFWKWFRLKWSMTMRTQNTMDASFSADYSRLRGMVMGPLVKCPGHGRLWPVDVVNTHRCQDADSWHEKLYLCARIIPALHGHAGNSRKWTEITCYHLCHNTLMITDVYLPLFATIPVMSVLTRIHSCHPIVLMTRFVSTLEDVLHLKWPTHRRAHIWKPRTAARIQRQKEREKRLALNGNASFADIYSNIVRHHRSKRGNFRF